MDQQLPDRQAAGSEAENILIKHPISTGAPRGCVPSPLLFCTSKDPSVELLKFGDDTTLIGLIQDGDECAYRQEVKELSVWCSLNNLELNTLKTVEMIVDFRRNTPALPSLTIMNSTVTEVDSDSWAPQFLRIWSGTIRLSSWFKKKAQQRLYFLFPAEQTIILCHHIESILCTSITVWFSSATKSDLRRLQRVVRPAERIIGTPLPTL